VHRQLQTRGLSAIVDVIHITKRHTTNHAEGWKRVMHLRALGT